MGSELPQAQRLRIYEGGEQDSSAGWVLRGITSNERYVERAEKTQLMAKQQALDSPDAICAALIPIRKSAAWWRSRRTSVVPYSRINRTTSGWG